MKHITLLLLALSFTAASGLRAQTVVYTETFPTSSGLSGPLVAVDTVDWQTFNTSSATDASAGTDFGGGFVINAQAGLDGAVGYLSTVNTSIGLTFTDEFAPINRSVTEIASLSLASNNSNTAGSFRFAIRIDVGGTPTWYATDATYSQIDGGIFNNFPTNGEIKTFTFTTEATAWRELTFTSGSTLSLSGTTLDDPLPMGNLTAAGFYKNAATSTMRLDNFEIAVIPEPSTYALVAGVLALLVCLRRRSQLANGRKD